MFVALNAWQPLDDFRKATRFFTPKLWTANSSVCAAMSSARRPSTAKPTPRKGIKTLVPVVPSKIIAVGLNYADHAREMNRELPKEPLIWFKATTSLLPDGGKIEIPFRNTARISRRNCAIVIGRKIRNVSPTQASRYIFGYTARRTSATARFKRPRANGRAPNRSTPSRRSARTWRRRLIRTN